MQSYTWTGDQHPGISPPIGPMGLVFSKRIFLVYSFCLRSVHKSELSYITKEGKLSHLQYDNLALEGWSVVINRKKSVAAQVQRLLLLLTIYQLLRALHVTFCMLLGGVGLPKPGLRYLGVILPPPCAKIEGS